ncbi:MAG: hypothetical protein J6N51_14740, partial [Selenomonas sp.]|nr:hypothetical protein [Selenomonas sp.]
GGDGLQLFPAHFKAISIHAPYTGGDEKNASIRNMDDISIHAPYTGGDGLQLFPAHFKAISIHAPYTGGDRLAEKSLFPNGSRLTFREPLCQDKNIYSSPHKPATIKHV